MTKRKSAKPWRAEKGNVRRVNSLSMKFHFIEAFASRDAAEAFILRERELYPTYYFRITRNHQVLWEYDAKEKNTPAAEPQSRPASEAQSAACPLVADAN